MATGTDLSRKGKESYAEQLDEMADLFAFEHLPPPLQKVSEPFHQLFYGMRHTIPASRELVKAVDKLVEAKDCAVRAMVKQLKKEEAGG